MHGGKVAVVGGSVGGCAAALAALRGGADEITVYERAGERLEDRGAGLAMHNSRYAELETAGYIDADVPWLQVTHRRWYTRDDAHTPLGRAVGVLPAPFRTYNWGPLWRELRARVPHDVRFKYASTVDAVELGTGHADVHTASGTERFDLVIGADGYRSAVRAAAFPDVRPAYAGYLAWRGTCGVDELMKPDLWAETELVYVVFPGGHLVAYRVPDEVRGQRVNWVMYTVPPPVEGLSFDTPTSLPPGTVPSALYAHLVHVADELLPPYWGAMVLAPGPDNLFLQPIYDFTAPRYTAGRSLLVGDAATVARPHTGAGAVKALQDATVLESAIAGAATWQDALNAYDAGRAAVGRTIVDLGRSLGDALVLNAPDWAAMDQAALEAHWTQADGTGSFGGRSLQR
ncbi:FAD-dependent monooxygenase [Yinghuangia seranimata]|uniref:FAD-dependent monooxygenase n=1 Tax=Yinghuangia seranimata TaxID=408067 RepID=UPI00248A9544|nr:FAD-dependent monooxygenase [Yinghuangia seranimata]MDI2129009.1 FAD-dependent monooxygenase [Yinghuangia seranimata]